MSLNDAISLPKENRYGVFDETISSLVSDAKITWFFLGLGRISIIEGEEIAIIGDHTYAKTSNFKKSIFKPVTMKMVSLKERVCHVHLIGNTKDWSTVDFSANTTYRIVSNQVLDILRRSHDPQDSFFKGLQASVLKFIRQTDFSDIASMDSSVLANLQASVQRDLQEWQIKMDVLSLKGDRMQDRSELASAMEKLEKAKLKAVINGITNEPEIQKELLLEIVRSYAIGALSGMGAEDLRKIAKDKLAIAQQTHRLKTGQTSRHQLNTAQVYGCPKCGNSCDSSATTCMVCGQNLDSCPHCRANLVRRGGKFCASCGKSLATII